MPTRVRRRRRRWPFRTPRRAAERSKRAAPGTAGIRARASRLSSRRLPSDSTPISAHSLHYGALSVVRGARITESVVSRSGQRSGLTTDAQSWFKVLERGKRELTRVNEILRDASAFFAAAELDHLTRQRTGCCTSSSTRIAPQTASMSIRPASGTGTSAQLAPGTRSFDNVDDATLEWVAWFNRPLRAARLSSPA